MWYPLIIQSTKNSTFLDPYCTAAHGFEKDHVIWLLKVFTDILIVDITAGINISDSQKLSITYYASLTLVSYVAGYMPF